MKLLIERIVSDKDNGTSLYIICDNHTTKVASANSFSDYIKLYLLYEKGYNIQLHIRYMDSNARNSYIIQAADYVANALYGYYEYSSPIYFNCFKSKINKALLFPSKYFGK